MYPLYFILIDVGVFFGGGCFYKFVWLCFFMFFLFGLDGLGRGKGDPNENLEFASENVL